MDVATVYVHFSSGFQQIGAQLCQVDDMGTVPMPTPFALGAGCNIHPAAITLIPAIKTLRCHILVTMVRQREGDIQKNKSAVFNAKTGLVLKELIQKFD